MAKTKIKPEERRKKLKELSKEIEKASKCKKDIELSSETIITLTDRLDYFDELYDEGWIDEDQLEKLQDRIEGELERVQDKLETQLELQESYEETIEELAEEVNE